MFEFLQGLAMDPTSITDPTALLGPILAVGIAFLVIALIIFLALYVYLSLAFMKIGKKIGLSENIAGLSWIPFLGPVLISYIASGMNWWPWIVISVGMMIPIVNIAVLIFLTVIIIIWMWKTFTAVGKPGWWSLIAPIGGIIGTSLGIIVPVLGTIISLIAAIAYLVFIGLAAWGSSQPTNTMAKPVMKPMVKPAMKPMVKPAVKPLKR